MSNKIRWALFLIFIAALFFRLFVVFTQEESKRLPSTDGIEYDDAALNIVSGNGFSYFVNGSMQPMVHRAPMYPMFLAFVYSIFGHNYVAAKVIQAIIGALFCIVIFYITFIIYEDIAIGLIASAFAALYKPFITGFFFYGGPALLLSEYFYMFILGLTILITVYFIKNANKKMGALSGIFIGLTILTRVEFILFPILLAVFLFYVARFSIKAFLKKYFIIYLFIILTMTPWVVRNYIIYKEFIPLTTLGGTSFLVGNSSFSRGGGIGHENTLLVKGKAIKNSENFSDNRKSKIYFKAGITELANNPKRIPKLFIKKILVHWAPFSMGFKVFNPFYAFILMFGAIGLLFFRKHIILENILLILLLSTTLTAMLIYGEPRYRYPYEPYLIIFTALAINEIIKRMKGNNICQK